LARKQPELTITMDIKEVPFTPERLEKFKRDLARLVAMGLDGTCTGKKKASAVTEAKGREKIER